MFLSISWACRSECSQRGLDGIPLNRSVRYNRLRVVMRTEYSTTYYFLLLCHCKESEASACSHLNVKYINGISERKCTPDNHSNEQNGK